MFHFFINLNESVPNWADIFSMLATVVTAMVAVKALFSWRAQKNYDVEIEALSQMRRCITVIKDLRSHWWDGNILNNDKAVDLEPLLWNGKLREKAEAEYEIFKQKRLNYSEFFDKVLLIREKVWASFGDKHPLYKFYDEVVFLDEKIIDANEMYVTYSYTEDTFKENREKMYAILRGQPGDDIEKTLEELMQNVRKNAESPTTWK